VKAFAYKIRARRVQGEGSPGADVMIIGDTPGKECARTGRPFRGKVGRELDRFFDGLRLPHRDACYVTNYVKEWNEYGEYSTADYARDEPELREEILRVRPRLIITLGRGITRFFLGDVDLDETYGIPWRLPADSAARALFAAPEAVVVYPSYAPGAGFRSPELSSKITYAFAQLEAVIAGRTEPRVLYDDPLPEPVYEEITDVATLDAAMVVGGVLATDTEGYAWAPWSVQFSTVAGHAYILRYSQRGLIERFAEWVNGTPGLYHFLFHNALHDLAVFRALGIDTRFITFDDTMIAAYNLQLEPQGLKPLCVRHCGMAMQSYDEILGDANDRLALDWLFGVMELEEVLHGERCDAEFTRLTTTPYVNGRGVTVSGRRLKVPPKLPRSALHKAVERCLRSKTPRKLWGSQDADIAVAGTQRFGDMWTATLDHVPLPAALHYAGRDSDGTLRVAPVLMARVADCDLDTVYRNDLGTVPLIDRMQQIGIQPDLRHFELLSDDLAAELVEIQTRIATGLLAVGWSGTDPWAFNANSTYQVGELLYAKFQLEVLKKTPGGDPSTNDKILEALEEAHPEIPLIGDIREYREVYKLKYTFVDQIPSFVHRHPHDGRIHPTFRITRVVSGRLAASDPNILAMPKHGKFATRFRAGFTAGAGRYIYSWDLSQIELRVLAHLSQDPVLLDAFRTGKDLHASLAERIFGVAPKDQDDSRHRLPAKAINFGIPMGMTFRGLTIELKKNGVQVTEDDAARWLADTMELYKSVPDYQAAKVADARRLGYVTDICGRRRYIGGIRSFDEAIRQEAERFSFSTPIQAGAQEVMKQAEAWAWEHVILPAQGRGEWVEPLIQIHDDIVIEAEQRLAPELHRGIVHAMTQTFREPFSVPIKTDGKMGVSWGELHSIEPKEKAA
jgi:uracil-DNA glycosylase family 4